MRNSPVTPQSLVSRKLFLFVATAMLVAASAPPTSVVDTQGTASASLLRKLQEADGRLSTVAYRLVTSNAPLCADQQIELGIQLHAIDQYAPGIRAQAVREFGFPARIAVENVVAGSPADAAGVRSGDGIVAVNGRQLATSFPGERTGESNATRDAAEAMLAALPRSTPVALTLRRDGQERIVTMLPRAGCRSSFEMLLDDGYMSGADGNVVQVSIRFLAELDDSFLAVVVAHELAHNILRHRARLEAAGAKWGMFAELGRSGRLNKQAEIEADQLSVYLLANAGLDPLLAGRFWRGPGRRVDAGLFRSRIYESPSTRAAALDAEAARIALIDARPIVPAMLALRDTPMVRTPRKTSND